jgi:glucose 1-dehydrogenase
MIGHSGARKLEGQRAIVTGAGSGIGAAIARALASAGATVIVNYPNAKGRESADRVVGEIEHGGGRALSVQADVSQEREVESLFKTAISELGSIDIMINNAGIQRDAPLIEMTLDQWNAVIAVNLTGQFLCTRAAAREFMRRGFDPRLSRALGKIICISSVHDVIPWAGHANYAASKGGVSMMMRSVAQELAEKGIRVNSISPGAIKTPINTSAWSTPEAEAQLLKLIPYNRVGDPEDIGRCAVWLASDEADYVSGATIYVDGGMLLYPGFRTGG